MKRYLLILCVFVLFSCKKEQGCTDQIAINFNSTAEEDDGSCIYSFVGGYWITQSITTEGSITTSAGGTIVSDSSFNFTETNPDSLSPYRIDFSIIIPFLSLIFQMTLLILGIGLLMVIN